MPEISSQKPNTFDISLQIDTSGLNCPLPILKTKKAMKSLALGDILVVLATDPLSVLDFKHYCYQFNNTLEEYSEENNVFKYVIRKGLID